MTNEEIRWWYEEVIPCIEGLNIKWIEEGYSIRQRAEQAWRIRHTARLGARYLMPNPWEIEALRERDMKKYNNPDGPTFEYCVWKAKTDGLEGDAVYEAIIKGSYRTNAGVNEEFGF